MQLDAQFATGAHDLGTVARRHVRERSPSRCRDRPGRSARARSPRRRGCSSARRGCAARGGPPRRACLLPAPPRPRRDRAAASGDSGCASLAAADLTAAAVPWRAASSARRQPSVRRVLRRARACPCSRRRFGGRRARARGAAARRSSGRTRAASSGSRGLSFQTVKPTDASTAMPNAMKTGAFGRLARDPLRRRRRFRPRRGWHGRRRSPGCATSPP